MARKTIVLAEDQQLICDSLRKTLETIPEYDVLAAFSNGAEVLEFLAASPRLPDLCVLDIQMPVLGGMECAKQIKERHPSVAILMLTSFQTEDYLEQGLLHRINGYFLKDSSLDAFTRTVQAVLDGQFVAPAPLMNRLAERYQLLLKQEQQRDFQYGTKQLSQRFALDEREIEIIRLIWTGWSNRMIADDLYISEGTAKNYITRIYRKLKINNRSELIQLLESFAK